MFQDLVRPPRWSWAIWNLCLFALGTLPSVQLHCGRLKPSSSVPNNEHHSNVLTSAQTHEFGSFPAPPCINRSIFSGFGTPLLWSPLWALHCYSLGATQVSPPPQSIQPIDNSCHLTFFFFLPLFVWTVSAEQRKCIEWGQTRKSIDILCTRWRGNNVHTSEAHHCAITGCTWEQLKWRNY